MGFPVLLTAFRVGAEDPNSVKLILLEGAWLYGLNDERIDLIIHLD